MKTKSFLFLLSFFLLIFYTQPNFARKSKIPNHPSKIKYKPLNWNIPLGSPYRTELKNGLRVYIAEDNSLPLITISGYYKTGTINDPGGKEGLGKFAVNLMRTGGTKDIPADELDDLIDHYAISFSFSMRQTQLNVKVQFLSQFIDTALYIFKQIIFHPAFEDNRIDKEREIAIQEINHRFDNPEPVLDAAYQRNMYPEGENSRLSSEKSMNSITKNDLIKFHRSVFKTENAIYGIAGNFSKNDILNKLESMFPKAVNDSPSVKFPSIDVSPKAKYLIVHKEISQAYVQIGLPFFTRPHPDYYAISVFNMILGGGSFTSRLGTKIRSDEGLTYSIYSYAQPNYIFPATFYINFFTKHSTVNKAVALTLKEVDKILEEGITKEEFQNAKKVLIESLPSMFRSKEDIVNTYAWNEYYSRSLDHFRVYPKKLRALKMKDIKRASQKHVIPKDFSFVIVGDTTEIFRAEASGGFSLKNKSAYTIITPDILYNSDFFNKSQ